MNILAIDTSTRNLSLALAENDQVRKYRNFPLGRFMSRSLMPKLTHFLKISKTSLDEIDAYAVGLGPGSFTSLRVGLSTIKGLVHVSGKPVVGIPSLDAIALNVDQKNVPICVVCDAKRSLIYGCSYRIEKGSLIREADYVLTNIKDFLRKIKKPAIFVGDGADLYEKEIHESKKDIHIILDEKCALPQAKYFVREAYQRINAEKTDNISTLVPLYLYEEDCQVRK